MTARADERTGYSEASRLERVAFWSPLPGTSELSTSAKALIRNSDIDIRQDRLESALDSTLALIAEEPEFIPGFIRTAELLIATRRRDHARRMLRTLRNRQSTIESSDFDLELSKIQAHVDPGIEVIKRFAEQLLEDSQSKDVTPYVPAAINRLVTANRTDEANTLATQWVDRFSGSPLALTYLVWACLASGDSTSALQTIRHFRDEHDADRVWPENIVVSALTAIASPDLEPKWMAAGPVCAGLRNRSLDYRRVTEVLEFLVPAFETPQRALLLAGLIALNAGDRSEAQAIFQTTPAETPVENFLRNVGLERSIGADEDQRSRMAALREIWQSFEDPQVAALSESSEIFDPPATRSHTGIAIARMLQDEEAYSDALQMLDDVVNAGMRDPEVLRLRAELMARAGSRNDALTALDQLSRQQEEKRKYSDAIDTLQSMVKLVPGNVQIRNRIVDNCLKVGRFEEAINQLVMQGRLLHKAGKVQQAETPVHRAIEIATMTSDWENVKKLHRLLISFAPEDTRLRHSAVTTYVQHGHTQEAINQLREIVRIARKQNDMDEAIAASHQMLALDPNDPSIYHQLGELLVSIQEYNQADRVYRRLANLVPDDHAVKAKRSAIAALTRSRQSSHNQ